MPHSQTTVWRVCASAFHAFMARRKATMCCGGRSALKAAPTHRDKRVSVASWSRDWLEPCTKDLQQSVGSHHWHLLPSSNSTQLTVVPTVVEHRWRWQGRASRILNDQDTVPPLGAATNRHVLGVRKHLPMQRERLTRHNTATATAQRTQAHIVASSTPAAAVRPTAAANLNNAVVVRAHSN